MYHMSSLLIFPLNLASGSNDPVTIEETRIESLTCLIHKELIKELTHIPEDSSTGPDLIFHKSAKPYNEILNPYITLRKMLTTTG